MHLCLFTSLLCVNIRVVVISNLMTAICVSTAERELNERAVFEFILHILKTLLW